MSSRVVVTKTRAHLNAALVPVVPSKGQFLQVCVCVGVEPAVHYYQLARGYSLVCGPPPSSGVLAQVGTHNSLVRALLQYYHADLDDRVFVPFNTTSRLSVGKQVDKSLAPVWNHAEAPKAHSLSSSFLRDMLSFKAPFLPILYDASPTSWFNAVDNASGAVEPAMKKVLLDLQQNVVAYAQKLNIAIAPPKEGEWWVSFERDNAPSTPTSSKKPMASFQIEAGALSLSKAFSSSSSAVRPVAQSASAPIVPPPLPRVPAVDFSRDRPRFAECIQQAVVLETAAVAALKKPDKAASRFECNALGLREDGSVPRHAREEQWLLVVEARKTALMVEASRKCVVSDFIFNAQGLTADGESFFKFCTNYDVQREAYSVDEVTTINLDVYDGVDYTYFADDMRKEVRLLRTTLGKRSRDLDDCSEEEIRSQFKKFARKVNKKAKKDGGGVGVYVTKHGELIVPESP